MLKDFLMILLSKCSKREFHLASGSSIYLALLVLLKRVFHFIGNKPSSKQKALMFHMPERSLDLSSGLLCASNEEFHETSL